MTVVANRKDSHNVLFNNNRYFILHAETNIHVVNIWANSFLSGFIKMGYHYEHKHSHVNKYTMYYFTDWNSSRSN